MREIVIEFNRYRRLGLHRREALSIAWMKYRVKRLLARHDAQRARKALPQ